MLFCSGTNFSLLEPCFQTYWIINPSTSSLPPPLPTIFYQHDPKRWQKVYQAMLISVDSRAWTTPRSHRTTACSAPPNRCPLSGRRNAGRHAWVSGRFGGSQSRPKSVHFLITPSPTLFVPWPLWMLQFAVNGFSEQLKNFVDMQRR